MTAKEYTAPEKKHTITAKELMIKLNGTPIVRGEIAMETQLGIPFAEKKRDRLCISFKPHREEAKDGKMQFYPNQYEVEFVYPSNHVVRFSNLTYKKSVDISAPVCETDMQVMLGAGKYALNALYDELTELLVFWEKDKSVSDAAIKKYQKSYYNTVKKLGLEKLYGEE
ncbi:MAG: hypothetical protein ACI4A5_04090 [Hominilimicola sp.]